MAGRWPAGVTKIPFLVQFPAGYEAQAESVAQGYEGWNRFDLITVRAAREGEKPRLVAVLDDSVPLPDIALTDMPVDATADTVLYSRWDPQFAGLTDLAKIAEAAAHEAGHALGLSRTADSHDPDPRSIMNAVLSGTVGTPSDYDGQQLAALYTELSFPAAPYTLQTILGHLPNDLAAGQVLSVPLSAPLPAGDYSIMIVRHPGS